MSVVDLLPQSSCPMFYCVAQTRSTTFVSLFLWSLLQCLVLHVAYPHLLVCVRQPRLTVVYLMVIKKARRMLVSGLSGARGAWPGLGSAVSPRTTLLRPATHVCLCQCGLEAQIPRPQEPLCLWVVHEHRLVWTCVLGIPIPRTWGGGVGAWEACRQPQRCGKPLPCAAGSRPVGILSQCTICTPQDPSKCKHPGKAGLPDKQYHQVLPFRRRGPRLTVGF